MVEIIPSKDVVRVEKPEKLTPETVIHWSEHYKRLEGLDGGNAIQAKAKKFLKNECIEYDKEKKQYICKPIKGYNKTTYKLPFKGGKFHCSCQYFQTKLLKGEEPYCSHQTALYMFLKMENWNRRSLKTGEPSAEVI